MGGAPASADSSLRAFRRQLIGETRKLWHPLVAMSLLSAAAAVCALQALHVHESYPGPSLYDLGGCFRIAALQHATAIGFVLAGVVAGVGTAEEAGSGALSDMALREPRRARLVLVKAVAISLTLVASMLLTTVSLWATSFLMRLAGTHISPRGNSPVGDTLIDVSCSLLVIAFAAAVSLPIALVARSIIATVALVAASFYLPLTILQERLLWATPTRWITEWLHLDPFGQGADYVGDNSPYDHRGVPAVISGLLLLAATVALLAISCPLLSRTLLRRTEQQI